MLLRQGWSPQRLEQAEWLDLGYGTLPDVAANLEEMWRINRYLGGLRALTRHLYPRLHALARVGEVTVADLGTGSAEIPLALMRWARRSKLQLRILAVDQAERQLHIARRHVADVPEVTLLRAEAGCLPLPPQSVDFVISSLFLHHVPPDRLVALLNSAHQVARRGMVMSDLVRGLAPWLAFKFIQPLFARSVLTRHDGALSIRRAYTPAELRALALAAGLSHFQVHLHWPWRMTLVSEYAAAKEDHPA
jgi:SAM-dependent methyltransferase